MTFCHALDSLQAHERYFVFLKSSARFYIARLASGKYEVDLTSNHSYTSDPTASRPPPSPCFDNEK